MRTFLCLTIFLFIWAQDTVYTQQLKNDAHLLNLEEDRSLHDSNNVNDEIENNFLTSRDFDKDVVERTDTTFKAWAEKAKEKISKLDKNFVEHLNKLKQELKKIFSEIKDTSGTLKVCLKEYKTKLENIFKGIIVNLKTCISNNTNKLGEQTKDITETENATENNAQKRNEADAINDRLSNIITCMAEGLGAAAKTIVKETLQIIQCIKKKKV